MKYRIFSQVVARGIPFLVATTSVLGSAPQVFGQSGPGYSVDPQTGIVYRKVARTIERPVVETTVESHDQTVYTPQTVHETRPETRTIYTPVVEHVWQPRMYGRWNPFRQPSIGYQAVPLTRWEARNEVVQRTNTRTEWVAQTRRVDVPQRVVRMEREQKLELEAVGRVAPQQSSEQEALAARLRPIGPNDRIDPLSSAPGRLASTSVTVNPRIATSAFGQMTSDPPRRSASQGGTPATALYPASPSVYGQALPPSSAGGVGVAGLPALPMFR